MIKVIVLIGLIAVCVMAVLVKARQQREARESFERRFATYEDFTADVDPEPIRAVLERKGEVAAVATLRRAYPGAPFGDARRYVRQLRRR
ncbi:hypothetical protein [Streptomyces sp. B6B3]|uniref:hypothetical protein n=1 Tax=Streptomyces sp. B6B3 TaxID=3153570 RepID=UPI00325E9E40